MVRFAGFPLAALDFYEDLEADNTRIFWRAHKDTYERCVRAPLIALTDELAPEFGDAKVFRPYRDIRFSKNKAPYKTHEGAICADRDGVGGLYVQIDAGGLLLAGGCYSAAPDQIARFRTAVDTAESGNALQNLVDDLRAAGHTIAGDNLKTRPRGYPETHPRIELLRHRTLYASRRFGAPDWLSSSRVRDVVAQAWREYQPLHEWFCQHVGPSQLPARRRR
jgi:uncharacterized protein (TIGR02453 family)